MVLHVILIALMLVITQLPTPSRFLIWNLFLAVIPFDLAWLYIYLKPQAGSKWILLGVALVWLLFYPNTLYMLTDYIHLQAVGVDLTGIYQVLIMLS
ncbi:Predicted membrane protein [Weissella viridescens]|uniref:Predicted membrane protein n=1 Tax=Weissella viridescens TaxID=1629 RepID=A0A380P972_WEIVI|nr:Predicted membrane protein [Weissella viridescens]